MTIYLGDIWPDVDATQYKIHFARFEKESRVQPLEVWLRSRREWQKWHEYRPEMNAFNRPFIFTVIQFYHETDIWLFGGIYRVLKDRGDRYDVELADTLKAFEGRLKLRSSYRSRGTRVNFENHYGNVEVQEILREPYSGRRFPGYESIDLSFEELETTVKNDRTDWKAALESLKGVYLISDILTGKRYVGSAYGEGGGIWSRWCSYVATGHGGNAELRKLVSDPTLDYCRKNFRFALLEHRPRMTPDETIIEREGFWKGVLLSRGQFGLNRN